MIDSREQYYQAIKHTAARPYTPIEVIDLIAAMWAMPRAVIEHDIQTARRVSRVPSGVPYLQMVGRLDRNPKGGA